MGGSGSRTRKLGEQLPPCYNVVSLFFPTLQNNRLWEHCSPRPTSCTEHSETHRLKLKMGSRDDSAVSVLHLRRLWVQLPSPHIRWLITAGTPAPGSPVPSGLHRHHTCIHRHTQTYRYTDRGTCTHIHKHSCIHKSHIWKETKYVLI